MKSLQALEKLIVRTEEAARQIAELEAAELEAVTKWQEAVTAGDAKAEAAASKALTAATEAVAAARQRFPVLADAVTRERRACLPDAAVEVAAGLEGLNALALPLAHTLLDAYEKARAAALEINELYKQHVETRKEFFAMCKEAGAPIPPLPHDGHFAVAVSELNRTFKPDVNERFRLTEAKLLLGATAPAEEAIA